MSAVAVALAKVTLAARTPGPMSSVAIAIGSLKAIAASVAAHPKTSKAPWAATKATALVHRTKWDFARQMHGQM